MAGRRVVVTGIGSVSPLCATASGTWQRVIEGASGIGLLRNVQAYEAVGIPTKLAAHVPLVGDAQPTGGDQHGDAKGTRFNKADVEQKHGGRALPDSIAFALAAADEAISDAQLMSSLAEEQGARVGVAVGTGISGLQELIDANNTLHTRGYRRVSPHLIPNSLVNMAAGLVSIAYGFKGPNHAVSTACATGAHAIGDAFRFIKYGNADVMVCGGTDACIMPVVVAGFARAKALVAGFEDDPMKSSRPFDVDRCGFVIGEGAALLVLEEYQHAKTRGAKIYAEVLGYGLSGDAHHITAPHESGSGALLAMKGALSEGQITPDQIDHINAHATSTPLGDGVECQAIKQLLGSAATRPTITSTKGATGHLLGAAGSLEAMMTVLSISNAMAPPTLNLNTPLKEGEGLCFVANTALEQEIQYALSNSFGFGGTNVSLLFARHAE
eukprot:m.71464 g.71464  ORF g.71464 m.71464 type:complete len:441 (+) comp13819_c0_seq2:225-1547(+)